MSKVTAYFVLYEKHDGTVMAGQICSTEACAVASIHPDETANTFGPYSVEVDAATDLFKRADKLDKDDAGVILRNAFGQHHPVVRH